MQLLLQQSDADIIDSDILPLNGVGQAVGDQR
jgi:hypothetical protein